MFDETVKLHHKEIGSGPALLIMHGLLGSLDNWSTISRSLAEYFTVFMLDLRNHGKSPHTEAFSYELMAKDVLRFIEDHEISLPHMIGHSMGGKVLFEMLRSGSDQLGKKIVLDIAPKAYPDVHFNILDVMEKMPLTQIRGRSEAEEWMKTYIDDQRVRQFILKNLDRNSHQEFEWKVNLSAVSKNYTNISSAISLDHIVDGEIYFVHGQLSDYVNHSDEDEIRCIFPQAKFIAVEGAGHWIHADQPQKLIEIIKNCFTYGY